MKELFSKKIIEKIKRNKEIIAVLLFGSYARKEPYRDIDVCLVLDKKYPALKMSRIKLEYSSLVPSKFDITIFQQLPLYIRKRILKEGKIILCKNESLLYEIAFSTIKEFEFYKKIYYNYLGKIEELK
ncbi:nucleotidyltransferase domain-containing protein [Candidatus Pacearchaeota archaeon]|nr:nucleotidyltransferase domain-containing protein [Candidatus Pacearchaeota archaeon]